MQSFCINTLYYFIVLFFLIQGCAKSNISDIRIERFEKLDEQPGIECYLVYGYHNSIEKETGLLIDKYVCDSVLLNIRIESTSRSKQKLLIFFKKTKNTNNNETYRSKIKRAIARRDVIFEYDFEVKEDSIIAPSRKRYRVNEPDMVSEPFRCN
jgi:hypothetical protein